MESEWKFLGVGKMTKHISENLRLVIWGSSVPYLFCLWDQHAHRMTAVLCTRSFSQLVNQSIGEQVDNTTW